MPSTLSPYREKLYDSEREEREKEFRSLVDLYISGSLTLDRYRSAMEAGLKEHYIRLALIAKGGRPLTEKDRNDIGVMLAASYDYLTGFSNVLEEYPDSISNVQALHRSGSYANAWGVYTRFALPSVIADLLPALPGLDCLGGMLCGCWLEWEVTDSEIHVYWYTNPSKEHCVLCLDATVSWTPYTIPLDEVDPDLLEEDYDFLYDL